MRHVIFAVMTFVDGDGLLHSVEHELPELRFESQSACEEMIALGDWYLAELSRPPVTHNGARWRYTKYECRAAHQTSDGSP